MAKKQPARRWVLAPSRRHKPQVPEKAQAEVKAEADELVEKKLRPRYITPPPEHAPWNYPVDVWTKWHGSFFYFGSTWASPGPGAIAPTFELNFARMEYRGDGLYNLAYLRHTGKWFEIFEGLSLKQCLESIDGGGPFSLV